MPVLCGRFAHFHQPRERENSREVVCACICFIQNHSVYLAIELLYVQNGNTVMIPTLFEPPDSGKAIASAEGMKSSV